MGRSEGEELPSCLLELLSLETECERQLLGEIFSRGWDQGCLIWDDPGLRAPTLAPHSIQALLERVADREPFHPARASADPFDGEPMPQVVPERDSGLVIVGQRCDLLKPLRTEPLVEVAIAHRSQDAELVAAARNGCSACYLHLTDLGAGTDGAWLLDVRTRGHLPKHWLRGRFPAQLVAPGRPRRRLAARLGERSSRIPVPTEIVDRFQNRLRGWLYSSTTRRAQCVHFSDLLLLETIDGAWAVIAVLGDGKDADLATADFDHLLGAIVERVGDFPISVEGSDVLRPEELSHADFLAAYKLDFSRVTYGSKSTGDAQAEPAVGVVGQFESDLALPGRFL